MKRYSYTFDLSEYTQKFPSFTFTAHCPQAVIAISESEIEKIEKQLANSNFTEANAIIEKIRNL